MSEFYVFYMNTSEQICGCHYVNNTFTTLHTSYLYPKSCRINMVPVLLWHSETYLQLKHFNFGTTARERSNMYWRDYPLWVALRRSIQWHGISLRRRKISIYNPGMKSAGCQILIVPQRWLGLPFDQKKRFSQVLSLRNSQSSQQFGRHAFPQPTQLLFSCTNS